MSGILHRSWSSHYAVSFSRLLDSGVNCLSWKRTENLTVRLTCRAGSLLPRDMAISKIIIVGAGPSGLLLALLLSKANIQVELLEMTDALDTNPRASHYTAESCYEFDRAGILDELQAQGFFPNGVSWRKLDEKKTRLVAIRNPEPAPGQENDPVFKYRMVCLPLHRLGKILETAVLAQPKASIKYGYKVVEIGQDDEKAWVEAETPKGKETRSADYIVGCDGANSIIRRRLFGDWVYPGFTWDEQIVATNVCICPSCAIHR